MAPRLYRWLQGFTDDITLLNNPLLFAACRSKEGTSHQAASGGPTEQAHDFASALGIEVPDTQEEGGPPTLQEGRRKKLGK